MIFIGNFLLFALKVYFYIIIISVIISWLVAFDVINVRNEKARNLMRLLDRATEPVYRPLRKFIPAIGGIDLTPIVVIFAIFILQGLVVRLFMMPL